MVQLVHYNSIICIKYTNHNSIKSYNYVLILQDGWTALHIAAFNNHPDLIEVLISNGCDISVVTKVRKTFVSLYLVFKQYPKKTI